MVNTGAHRLYGDNDYYYYAYSPGLNTDAAQWLVDRGIKLLGIDVQALDHPLGTRIAEHGPGPIMPHLLEEYRRESGHEVRDDFPLWEPAHRVLLCNGVPGIENVGGELDLNHRKALHLHGLSGALASLGRECFGTSRFIVRTRKPPSCAVIMRLPFLARRLSRACR
jgi:kynurenine formamidase